MNLIALHHNILAIILLLLQVKVLSRELLLYELIMHGLLNPQRMGSVTFSLDQMQIVKPVFLELGVLKYLIGAVLNFGLVKIIHI